MSPQLTNKKDLTAEQREYEISKAAYQKHRHNPGVLRRYVNATVRYGHGAMTAESLASKVKYRKALQLYREAIKLDSKAPMVRQVAQPEADLIVSIYKSMHRPVPGG